MAKQGLVNAINSPFFSDWEGHYGLVSIRGFRRQGLPVGRDTIEVPGIGIGYRMKRFINKGIPLGILDLVTAEKGRLGHLLEIATQFLEGFVHIRIRGHHHIDALNGVDDGAVVASAKMIPDGF